MLIYSLDYASNFEIPSVQEGRMQRHYGNEAGEAGDAGVFPAVT